MVSYDSAAKVHKLEREEASLGKIDAICDPLEIVEIVEGATPALGDYVIDRRILAWYQ